LDKIKINGDRWSALEKELLSKLFFNPISNGDPSPETIYHYTSLQGLKSIIETQKIYCTNINFLNDKKEYKYGVDLIRCIIENFKGEDSNILILKMVEENIDLIFNSERYVTCFSKNGDLLSQWRAYANHGKGVAIGFDFKLFATTTQQVLRRKHIVYDQEYQNKRIKEVIQIIIQFYEKRKDMIDWEDSTYEKSVAKIVIKYLEDIIAYYKHPSFSEEQEYRFQYEIDSINTHKGDEEILFRTSDTMLIPYIELHPQYNMFIENKTKGKCDDHSPYPSHLIRQFPINKLIIGPSLDYEAVKLGIKELLRKNDYKDVAFEESKIPYRI